VGSSSLTARHFAAFPLYPACGVCTGRAAGPRESGTLGVNAARDRGEHFVLYTCVDQDTLCSAVASAPRLSFHYRITPFQFPEGAPYFSGKIRPSTLCFDDAALA
jgi:hypothetical protein